MKSTVGINTTVGPALVPAKFAQLRSHQSPAITEIETAYRSGAKVVILDAPTGSGKTIIGEVSRQVRGVARTLYVCTTKTLQQQFLADFPYAALIQGRANYPTHDHPEDFPRVSAANCTAKVTDPGPQCVACEETGFAPTSQRSLHCAYCHPVDACPYRVAKETALQRSQLTVANTAYFLSEANFVRRMSGHFGLVIVDEADTLEQVLMSHVELSLTDRQLRLLDVGKPKKVTKAESWLEWLEEAYSSALNLADVWAKSVESFESRGEVPPAKNVAAVDEYERLAAKIATIKREVRDAPDNWIYDKAKGSVLRPIEVAPYAKQYLWDHAERWLLMSATTISAEQMADDLGLELPYTSVEVPSTFDPARRPVYVLPSASMTHKTKDVEYPKMFRAVAEVVAARPDVRILVHTVSYDLAKQTTDYLRARFRGRTVLTYTRASDREETLRKFRQSPGSVLVASSMDRGVDLPYDECRVVIVAKVPWPNLGDKQVAARVYGTGSRGRSWFAVQAIRTLVQMSGRAMRAADDECETFILDSQFHTNLWAQWSRLFPRWWRDSLVFLGPGEKLPENPARR